MAPRSFLSLSSPALNLTQNHFSRNTPLPLLSLAYGIGVFFYYCFVSGCLPPPKCPVWSFNCPSQGFSGRLGLIFFRPELLPNPELFSGPVLFFPQEARRFDAMLVWIFPPDCSAPSFFLSELNDTVPPPYCQGFSTASHCVSPLSRCLVPRLCRSYIWSPIFFNRVSCSNLFSNHPDKMTPRPAFL